MDISTQQIMTALGTLSFRASDDTFFTSRQVAEHIIECSNTPIAPSERHAVWNSVATKLSVALQSHQDLYRTTKRIACPAGGKAAYGYRVGAPRPVTRDELKERKLAMENPRQQDMDVATMTIAQLQDLALAISLELGQRYNSLATRIKHIAEAA